MKARVARWLRKLADWLHPLLPHQLTITVNADTSGFNRAIAAAKRDLHALQLIAESVRVPIAETRFGGCAGESSDEVPQAAFSIPKRVRKSSAARKTPAKRTTKAGAK